MTPSHDRPRHRAAWCAVDVLIVVGLVVVVLPLAYASPPDPSWITGFYDDADGDDAVLAITSGHGASDVPRRPYIVTMISSELVPPAVQPKPSIPSRWSVHGRAPPPPFAGVPPAPGPVEMLVKALNG
jgi:hypothetical protein